MQVRGTRHDFYTLLLMPGCGHPPDGWQRLGPMDAMQLDFDFRRHPSHSPLRMAVDHLKLYNPKHDPLQHNPQYNPNVASTIDMKVVAVGRQYYADCQCSRDHLGRPCCFLHCDDLFPQSGSGHEWSKTTSLGE